MRLQIYMLLIFIFSCYSVVSVSSYVNNNRTIVVAYNKQVGWVSSVPHCRSVSQLGQFCFACIHTDVQAEVTKAI